MEPSMSMSMDLDHNLGLGLHNFNKSLTSIFGDGEAKRFASYPNWTDADYEDALPPPMSTESPSHSADFHTHSPWFLAYGLGITIIAILGIFGNLCSALVLSRPQMRSSVTCLLLGLAFCDTLLISISILIFGLPAISDYTSTMLEYRFHFYPLWVQYLYPISITAQTGSVYLTLSVTIERYVAVCYSLHARSLCTWSRARACVLIVLLLATAYNGPRWFEVCVEETEFRFEDNSSVYENVMCPLRSSWAYKTYYINWSYLLVMYLVPFLGLVVLNWAIYQQVRRANLARQVLSKHQRREMGLATMLLFVVSVFLLCNVLPLVNNVLESFYDTSYDTLVQISNFLVIFNSSVNFVIYCTCGERFRRRLVRMCKEWYYWGRGALCGGGGGGRAGSGGANGGFQLNARRQSDQDHWRRGKRTSMSSTAGAGQLNRLGGPRGSVNGTMTMRLGESDVCLRRDTIVSFQDSPSVRLHPNSGVPAPNRSRNQNWNHSATTTTTTRKYFHGGGSRKLSPPEDHRDRHRDHDHDEDSLSSTSFTRDTTRDPSPSFTPSPSPSRPAPRNGNHNQMQAHAHAKMSGPAFL